MSLIAILIASLLGSPHCAGMCGGFVAFYSAQKPKSLLPQMAYSLGRLLTYSCLGAAAGVLGASINNVGAWVGLQRTAAIVIGLLMVLWGLGSLLGLKSFTSIKQGFFEKLIFPLHKLLSEKRKGSTETLAFTLGLLTTFLPCGWLYAYVALAAASGSALSGVAVMGVFWLGTLPVMWSLAGITAVLSLKARAYIPRVTASLMIAAGLFALYGKFEIIDRHLAIVPEQSTPTPTKHHCH